MDPGQSTWENCKNVVYYVYVLICVLVCCKLAVTLLGGGMSAGYHPASELLLCGVCLALMCVILAAAIWNLSFNYYILISLPN
jgi:hypothetical protein